jgi:membrane-associated protein
MRRRRFLLWSFVGAVFWVLSITLLGFFLGTRIPWLRDNIDLAILAILALSVIPVAYEWIRHRRNGRRRASAVTPEETPEPAAEGVES